jgi:hypothetical protein
MELVIGIVVVALIALGILAFVVLTGTSRAQRKSESNADSILDSTFDGRDSVTYAINMRTLKYETVVTGAKKRGYKLAHQAENQYGPSTLVFEKA